MKVKEVMTKDVISILPTISVVDAAKKLFELKISGLPVIDENGNLCGMFTEKDILKYILPSYVEQVGKFVYLENPKGIVEKIKELANLKVKDIMRKEVITVYDDTTLCEVARLMLVQKARRIVVLNRENKVVGIVAREDVLKALLTQKVDG